MKIQVKRLGAIFCAAALFLCASGCSTSEPDTTDVGTVYQQALQNSLKEQLYFWKETTVSGKDSTYRQVNVNNDLDKNYKPLVDADGNYTSLKVAIQEKSNQKMLKEFVCGSSSGINSGDPVRGMLFTTEYNDAAEAVSKIMQPMEAKNLLQNDAFQKYALSAMLSELSELTAGDMDFTVKKGLFEKKGQTTTLEFGVKQEYIQRYEQEHNVPSLFAGSDRVSIEITYDRISHIVVYLNDETDKLGLEIERYKLDIVYFGPKVSVPSYNETVKGSSQTVWQEIAS